MVRPSQLLHPQREPAPTHLAATVLLLRDTPHGLEVLMSRRSPRASFAPGMYVFPGGYVDAADAQAHPLATRRPAQGDEALTHAIAAIRESFEELGIVLARHESGLPVAANELAGLDRHAPLPEQCAARGWRLAAADVFPLARWIAARDLPKRFDTPFLVARMPPGQTPVADEAEQFDPCWVTPAHALAEHSGGRFPMIFPTVRTLQRLAQMTDVDAVLHACAGEQPLWTSCPRGGWVSSAKGPREARYMESDPPYGELELVSPDGQLVHSLDWQHEQAVPLLRNVQRLTAANPGRMTGPGTNSYLIGDAASGYVVVDPGPADPPHLRRLHTAAGGDIRAIVCTHSHPDHAPGAPLLQLMCAHRPPVLGLPSGPHARADSVFAPQRALAHNEQIRLSADGPDGRPDPQHQHTLRVIHTPGHTANHLCLVLEEDGLLLSGDHILNGSTTLVNPPDGDMSDYLASLDALSDACRAFQVQHILPAHGYVLGDALGAIARLKAHRLQREAAILAAVQAQPEGSLHDWVAAVYTDLPPGHWDLAKRSLQAHLERLRATGALP